MRNQELNLKQFKTLSDEELQKQKVDICRYQICQGGEANLLLGGSLKQSNFSDAYSSFYNATHQKEVFMDLDLILKITMIV